MVKERASIFGASELPKLDVSTFKPKVDSDSDAPTKEQVKAVSESKSFKSREAPAPAADTGRRTIGTRRVLRTGRNVQFNAKVSQEVIDDIYAITDAHQGWVLGYTLERAIAALKRELATETSEDRRPANSGPQAGGQGVTSVARV